MTTGPQPIYSTKQAAQVLGIHEGHLRRLAARLGIGRIVGKQRVFTNEDIDTLQERDRKPGPKQKHQDASVPNT